MRMTWQELLHWTKTREHLYFVMSEYNNNHLLSNVDFTFSFAQISNQHHIITLCLLSLFIYFIFFYILIYYAFDFQNWTTSRISIWWGILKYITETHMTFLCSRMILMDYSQESTLKIQHVTNILNRFTVCNYNLSISLKRKLCPRTMLYMCPICSKHFGLLHHKSQALVIFHSCIPL